MNTPVRQGANNPSRDRKGADAEQRASPTKLNAFARTSPIRPATLRGEGDQRGSLNETGLQRKRQT